MKRANQNIASHFQAENQPAMIINFSFYKKSIMSTEISLHSILTSRKVSLRFELNESLDSKIERFVRNMSLSRLVNSNIFFFNTFFH
jgi:hypothetical protein